MPSCYSPVTALRLFQQREGRGGEDRPEQGRGDWGFLSSFHSWLIVELAKRSRRQQKIPVRWHDINVLTVCFRITSEWLPWSRPVIKDLLLFNWLSIHYWVSEHAVATLTTGYLFPFVKWLLQCIRDNSAWSDREVSAHVKYNVLALKFSILVRWFSSLVQTGVLVSIQTDLNCTSRVF